MSTPTPPPPTPPPSRPPPGAPAPSTPAGPLPAPVPADAEVTPASSFAAEEGALLILSLVLALMAWFIVRAQVDTELTLHARLEFETPPDCSVFADNELDFDLHGKRGELEEVRNRLQGGRELVRLTIGRMVSDRQDRPIRHGDDVYRLPFPERLLRDPAHPPLPKGVVVRLLKQVVAVAPPKLPGTLPRDWPEGLEVQVELLTPSLEVIAPAGAFNGPLEPDPLDLTPFVGSAAGLAAPVQVELAFEGWRHPPGSRAEDPLVRKREAVVLPEVRASLRFVLAKVESFRGPVEVVIRPGCIVAAIFPPAGSAFTGTEGVEELGGRVDPVFTGEIRATREVHEQLRKRPDAWRWVLRVRDEDLPTDPGGSKRVTATLSLVAFEALARSISDGEALFEPVPVPVEVRNVR